MHLNMLRFEVDNLRKQILEDCRLFRADFAGRKAVYESNLKNLLATLNRNLGYVEDKEDIWYSADEQRYLPLMSAVSWKAEMNGYTIFDPGEGTGILWETQYDNNGIPLELTEYEETGSQEPGITAELMNIFAPEYGPYQFRVYLDTDIVRELMDEGVSLLDACKWAQDCYFYEVAAGGLGDPIEVGYEANVEDQAWLVDRDFSRGQCDADDSWDGEQAYRKEMARPGQTGVCSDRAAYMRLTATQRNDRFIQELNYIATANPKDIRSRYAWNRDPSKKGLFWQTVDAAHSNNPEPGLQWLTNSHTVLVNFAYRRRLGINISAGLLKAATHAADNVAEQMKTHCDISDFNLADIEGHVNGHTEYFEQLGRFYAARQG